MTREIPLTRGMVALVDDEDYERVMALGKWNAHDGRRTFYAAKGWLCQCVPNYPRQQTLRLHNFILGVCGVDHKNGDGLDNRRCNLRSATVRQNNCNVGLRRDNSSGFKGVTARKDRWLAQVMAGGKRVHLGVFDTAEDAARAYDAAAREHFGDFAWLNFPLVAEGK